MKFMIENKSTEQMKIIKINKEETKANEESKTIKSNASADDHDIN